MDQIRLRSMFPKECYPIEGELTLIDKKTDKLIFRISAKIEYSKNDSLYKNDDEIVINELFESDINVLQYIANRITDDRCFKYYFEAPLKKYTGYDFVIISNGICKISLDSDITFDERQIIVNGTLFPLYENEHYCDINILPTEEKETGYIRRFDDLGRIVIPKDIRKQLGIKIGFDDGEDVPMEIFLKGEDIILRKYKT